ncbi:MAG: hypothetical protein LBJ31_05715 [Treponema sp.]|jgi:cell division protein FtsW (lipid II flippase)|nr:hypothetical protein [Treponema sp.]
MVLFVSLLQIICRLVEGKTNWFDYGNKNMFIIFVAMLLFIIVFSFMMDLKKSNFFGNDPKKIKSWIPFIFMMLFILSFLIISVIFALKLKLPGQGNP